MSQDLRLALLIAGLCLIGALLMYAADVKRGTSVTVLHRGHFPNPGDAATALFYYLFFCLLYLPVGVANAAADTPAESGSGLSLEISNIAFTLVIYAPLLLRWALLPHSGRRRISLLNAARLLGTGLAGVFAFIILYQLSGLYGFIVNLSGAPALQQVSSEVINAQGGAHLAALGVSTLLIAPVCEEVFHRGFVFTTLLHRCGFVPAALMSGLLFGALHFALPQFLPLSFLGFTLAWVYYRSRSLWLPIVLHALFNAFNFVMLVLL